jgi:hypothetical protein
MRIELTCQVSLNRINLGRKEEVSDWRAGRLFRIGRFQTRRIITAVDLIKAAATCPTSSRSSRTASESIITRRSAEELKLKKGDTLAAVVKATEVMIQKD